METSSSRSILIVAPGCPAGVIQELLDASLLPAQTEVEVLLPPENTQQYDHLIDRKIPSGGAKCFPSPARSFFSTRHLKWLSVNLRFSENAFVLIIKSPYQDLGTALISLAVLMLSGKAITLFFATPDAYIDLNGQGFSERWIAQNLNLKILAGEGCRIFWFLNPWDILYFLMFGGLILRQWLSDFLPSISQKSVHQRKTRR